MHFSQGWVQFGYRFSNDFAPFALILVALGIAPPRRPRLAGRRAGRRVDRGQRVGRLLGRHARLVSRRAIHRWCRVTDPEVARASRACRRCRSSSRPTTRPRTSRRWSPRRSTALPALADEFEIIAVDDGSQRRDAGASPTSWPPRIPTSSGPSTTRSTTATARRCVSGFRAARYELVASPTATASSASRTSAG